LPGDSQSLTFRAIGKISANNEPLKAQRRGGCGEQQRRKPKAHEMGMPAWFGQIALGGSQFKLPALPEDMIALRRP